MENSILVERRRFFSGDRLLTCSGFKVCPCLRLRIQDPLRFDICECTENIAGCVPQIVRRKQVSNDNSIKETKARAMIQYNLAIYSRRLDRNKRSL